VFPIAPLMAQNMRCTSLHYLYHPRRNSATALGDIRGAASLRFLWLPHYYRAAFKRCRHRLVRVPAFRGCIAREGDAARACAAME